ncbi:hypothetical protein AAJ76_2300044179 [Vairimorpha ceranae]|uniref:Uncharacterized protein n=1 Tax=Vairimorpha ceranae TaxID=40302 RepID=A0A0F9YS58_9MICR|nr:hypothetical protein AAJ76_2300044179 [Vairimorpha ceranae]KAF5140005.1 hypothetical protein G9O61_00g017300 [Vairimorpha ceranae]KKO75382.1 hypothetical protein AAJ76_2300044179 [Vairimorpha ceranae]
MIFLLFALCFSHPLGTLIFHKNSAELSFDDTYYVKDYTIMAGALKANAEQFISIHRDTSQVGQRDSLHVSLDKIKQPESNKEYSIRVTIFKNGKDEYYYSESFRYHIKQKKWVLSRAYESDPWYIERLWYIIGCSVLLGCGLILYIVLRNRKNTELEQF